jgi:hypothetical protein
VIEIGKGRSSTGTNIQTRTPATPPRTRTPPGTCTRTPPGTCTSTESATNKAGRKKKAGDMVAVDERRIPPTSMKHKGDHVLFDIADDKGMFSRRKDDSVSRVER